MPRLTKIPDLQRRARHDIDISLPQGLFGFLRIYTTDEQRALDVRVLQISSVGLDAVVGLLRQIPRRLEDDGGDAPPRLLALFCGFVLVLVL